jgi:hypothetical protein
MMIVGSNLALAQRNISALGIAPRGLRMMSERLGRMSIDVEPGLDGHERFAVCDLEGNVLALKRIVRHWTETFNYRGYGCTTIEPIFITFAGRGLDEVMS